MAFEEIIIHAGMTKTGSTSLQLGLKAIASDLQTHGVVFPDFPGSGSNGANHGMALRHLCGFRTEAPFGHNEKYHDTVAAAQVFGTFDAHATGGRRLILSSETLPAMPESALRTLSHKIRAWGSKNCKLRMIVVVRHPLQWMNSSRNEFLRHGLTEQDLYHPEGIMAHAWQDDWLNASLSKLKRAGLADALTVVRYEDLPQSGGIFKAFGDWAGLPVSIPEVQANASLSWESLKLLEGCRSSMPVEPHEAAAQLMGCPGTKSAPTANEASRWQNQLLEGANRALVDLGLTPYDEEVGCFDPISAEVWSSDFLHHLDQVLNASPAMVPFVSARLHALRPEMSAAAQRRVRRFRRTWQWRNFFQKAQ